MRKLTIGLITLVVVAVLICVLCTHVRRPYETVILDRFGKIIPTVERDEKGEIARQHGNIAYNWYFNMPTDKIVRMDRRMHLYQSPVVELNTNRSEPISIKSFAAWHISDPVSCYLRLGGGDVNIKKVLDQKVPGTVGEVMGRHQIDEIFGTDEKIKQKSELLEAEILREANKQLMPLGLTLDQVGFSRLAFPPAVAGAVYGRMTTERAILADQARSEGDRDASIIRAKGSRTAAEIKAKAVTESQRLRGEGDAEAFKLVSDAQNTPEAREFYQFWKSMELLKNSFKDKTWVLLTPDNPIVSPFHQMPNGKDAVPASMPAK